VGTCGVLVGERGDGPLELPRRHTRDRRASTAPSRTWTILAL